jgi:hypothetical protein
MKFENVNLAKFATYMVLVIGFSASASASCGGSLSAMAAGATAAVSQSHPMQQEAALSGVRPVKASIVGLWHVEFKVAGKTIQEAYQLWNAGGTEVHNPNVDPRTGDVCLGVWKQATGTYTLVHRVWNYDSSGDFLGTIHLSETLTVGQGGNAHKGSFKLAFFDPSGKFVSKVTGSVTGRRISVE